MDTFVSISFFLGLVYSEFSFVRFFNCDRFSGSIWTFRHDLSLPVSWPRFHCYSMDDHLYFCFSQSREYHNRDFGPQTIMFLTGSSTSQFDIR